MEYQKTLNELGNAPNQPSKFEKNWAEINDDARGTYNTNSQTRFKTSMLKWRLCGYNEAYILVSQTISVEETSAAGSAANNTNKKVIFKNCTPFNNCIREINNIQVDTRHWYSNADA